jgi:hypothetical protein
MSQRSSCVFSTTSETGSILLSTATSSTISLFSGDKSKTSDSVFAESSIFTESSLDHKSNEKSKEESSLTSSVFAILGTSAFSLKSKTPQAIESSTDSSLIEVILDSGVIADSETSSLKKSIITSEEVSSTVAFLTSLVDLSQKSKISSSESEFIIIKSSSCHTGTAINYI